MGRFVYILIILVMLNFLKFLKTNDIQRTYGWRRGGKKWKRREEWGRERRKVGREGKRGERGKAAGVGISGQCYAFLGVDRIP